MVFLIIIIIIIILVRQGLIMQPWLAWNSQCRPNWPQTHTDLPSARTEPGLHFLD